MSLEKLRRNCLTALAGLTVSALASGCCCEAAYLCSTLLGSVPTGATASATLTPGDASEAGTPSATRLAVMPY